MCSWCLLFDAKLGQAYQVGVPIGESERKWACLKVFGFINQYLGDKKCRKNRPVDLENGACRFF
ncbi:hypothetical protein A33Q_1469 [Indibacter alkaliphilus LW1]|uniref:Uncharacterized protein n=1 Tax=Indibacter alkaliphilus (strain CCUG 57479 / KCTC 22604 / LW1) TaxID=1189612 RepID=S2DGC4_INDAL|nr:hypothetical protein A33Q_1469 [Indibacter alkaliphilus LW1]